MCGPALVGGREHVVDFSVPTLFDQGTFMVQTPDLKLRDWLVFRPFTTNVWLLLMITFLVSIVLLDRRRKTEKITGLGKLRRLEVIFLQLYAVLLRQCKFEICWYRSLLLLVSKFSENIPCWLLNL